MALEIAIFKALNNFDGDDNGGRESYTQVVDNTLYNVFPRIVYSDREEGSLYNRYRKIFIHNVNSDQHPIHNLRVWIDKLSTGDDYFGFYIDGTYSDIQSEVIPLIATTDLGYTGRLDSAVSAGATSIDVDYDTVTFSNSLRSGDKLYITNLKDMNDSTHHSEWNEIDSVVYTNTLATITLKNSLTYDYPVSYEDGGTTYYTRVAKYKEIGDLTAYTDTVVATTAGDGDYNEVTYPIKGDNKGSVRDSITLTFTSATAYNAVGSYLGSLGSGTTSSDFSPNNPNTSTPYFTISHLGWTGTWANGDTLTFELYPASQSIWIKEYIIPTCGSIHNNVSIFGIYGESA